MRSGRLDRRITLQKRTVVRDTFGDATDTWTDIETVWAQVIHDRGTEKPRPSNEQLQAQAFVTFRVRWRDDLSADMRVIWGGNAYDVTAIMEIGRRLGADLQAFASIP